MLGRNRGLSLIEILLIIVIIVLLAILAIPRMVDTTEDTQEAMLTGNLALLRTAIQLYYHQHGGQLPGAVRTDGSGDPTADCENPATLLAQVMAYSDERGRTSRKLPRSEFPFGPYVHGVIPENPVSGSNSIKVISSPGDLTKADLDESSGWLYNKETGEIRANSRGFIAY